MDRLNISRTNVDKENMFYVSANFRDVGARGPILISFEFEG